MPVNSINLIYFSPVNHTKTISQTIGGELANNLGISNIAEYDITKPTSQPAEIGVSTLAVIGVPVFGGRVPELAVKHLRLFKGAGTPAVLVASYGNRAFEDALLELNDVAVECGFKPIAAAACIAEHTIAPAIANGRPNDADIQSLKAFASTVSNLLSDDKLDALPDLVVPGNRPYREYKPMPLPQHVDDSCIECGICAEECPAGAISASDSSVVDANKCFCCMRCINVCSIKARHPEEAFINAVFKMLSTCCDPSKKNSYYFPAMR